MRKVCVVTATRAEYGSLKHLLDCIKNDNYLKLQLIVTGTHLSPEFGMTIDQIINDGFEIDKKIEILLSSDTPVGISKSMGLLQISISEAFDDLQPDILLVQGDRYELLPVVSSANIARIPVAHLSGGEITEGAIDDMIRHSITKLSHIHFTTMKEYSNRVIQMGEEPSSVFTVGEISLDNIKTLSLLTREQFESSIGRKLKMHNLLFTYHPETTESIEKIETEIDEIIKGLDKLTNTLIIFTKANADVGGRLINKKLECYCNKNPEKSVLFDSLGQLRYFSALQYMDAVVGNSSSGLTEVPSFKIPTINIGNRQKGRVRGKSVIDTPPNAIKIQEALQKIYSTPFKEILRDNINPYGNGNSTPLIIDILKKIDLTDLYKKKFFNINIDG